MILEYYMYIYVDFLFFLVYVFVFICEISIYVVCNYVFIILFGKLYVIYVCFVFENKMYF